MNAARFFLLHHYELLVDHHLFFFFLHSLLLLVGVLRTHVSVLSSVITLNCRLNHTCTAKRCVAYLVSERWQRAWPVLCHHTPTRFSHVRNVQIICAPARVRTYVAVSVDGFTSEILSNVIHRNSRAP